MRKKKKSRELLCFLDINDVLRIFTSSAAVIPLKELSNVCDGSDLAATDGIPFISPETRREKYDLGDTHCTAWRTEKFSVRGNFVKSFLQ